MNTWRRWAGGAAVSGLVVLALVATDAAGAGAKRGQTIVLTAGPPVSETVDIGAPGPSPGDLLVGRADVFDRRDKKVGFVRFTCVWNIGTGIMCTNHTTLRNRGQIVTQQSGDPEEGPVVIEAVTGGTGEFRTARGQARVDFSEGVHVTIHLIR